MQSYLQIIVWWHYRCRSCGACRTNIWLYFQFYLLIAANYSIPTRVVNGLLCPPHQEAKFQGHVSDGFTNHVGLLYLHSYCCSRHWLSDKPLYFADICSNWNVVYS